MPDLTQVVCTLAELQGISRRVHPGCDGHCATGVMQFVLDHAPIYACSPPRYS